MDGKKVLLVDDRNPVLTDTTSSLLQRRGYDVTSCQGYEFQGKPNDHTTDAILYIPVDFAQGPFLTRELRSRYPAAKIVVYSTRPFLEAHRNEIECFGAHPLEMPKRPEEIATALS